jgi:hypothetical protein
MKTHWKELLLVGLLGLGAGGIGSANAALCNGFGMGGQAIFGEVIPASSCEGMFAGNIPQDGSPDFGMGPWTLLDHNLNSGELYDGALSIPNGGTSGSWSINDVNNMFDDFDFFVIGLKPDGGFGFFLVGGNTSGTWSTSHGLSHAILYGIQTGTPPNETPEPQSLALIGLGLLGLMFVSRRRRA